MSVTLFTVLLLLFAQWFSRQAVVSVPLLHHFPALVAALCFLPLTRVDWRGGVFGEAAFLHLLEGCITVVCAEMG